MQIDKDRCHFCNNWTKEYRRIGDRSICKDCVEDLIEIIRDEL